MTQPQCAAGCGRPSPSAVLCGECTGKLRHALQLAAFIDGDLLAAVARQLRRGAGPRGDSQPLLYDPAASAARQALSLALAGAIYRMTGPGGWPIDDTSITGMARWLLERLNDVCQHPSAARAHAEVRDALARAVRVLDPPPDKVYAGPCPACAADILAEPWLYTARCRCGQEVEVAAQQAAMRAAVEDMLGGGAWCARMAARLGLHAPENTIYSWARRGQLARHASLPDRNGDLQPAYRLGDVLDLAARNPRRH